MAIAFGIFTALGFTNNAIIIKHLTSPRIGFHPTNMAFTGYMVANSFVLAAGIFVWIYYDNFDPMGFIMGLAGSIINTVGIVFA